MKQLTRYILLFCTCCTMFFATSCSKNEEPKVKETPQTIIVYMSGTSLGWAFNNNVQDMEEALKVGIQGDSRVVVVWQNGTAKQAEAMELIYNKGTIERKTLAQYELSNIMSEEDLAYIFNDVIRLAPAHTYGLIIGGHSWAWVPLSDYDELSSNSTQLNAKLYLRQKVELPRHLQTRFVGDSSGANRFDITTLSAALSKTGTKFEYILFDACFMANIEAAYELRNNTKYIIGSVCEIMGNGFPYTKTLPFLLQNNGTSYNLAAAAQTFHTHYKSTLNYSGTIALINCSQLDALATEMKRVNENLSDEYELNSLQSYEGGTNHIFFDLGDYVDKVCTNEAAKSSFKAQLEKSVPTKFTLDTFWSTYVNKNIYAITSYSGLSTSAPSILCRESYRETAWYKATH